MHIDTLVGLLKKIDRQILQLVTGEKYYAGYLWFDYAVFIAKRA